MKPLTLGAGHLLVVRSPSGINVKLSVKYLKYWTADLKWRKLWSSQLWTQFMQVHIWKPANSQDFNGVSNCDAVTPVQCSNQLSYEGTDVRNWSLVGPGEPGSNECELIIWNLSNIELRMWNKVSYDARSYECNLCNWVYRSLK